MNRVLAFAFVLLAIAACSGNNVGGAGGAPPCSTCADVYTNGGIACGPGPAAESWQALENCACTGACEGACIQSFCVNKPADMGCSTCIGMSCQQQLMACNAN